MLVTAPVELAKPNLKVGGIVPFTAAKFGMSIALSPGPLNKLSPFKSMLTKKRLGIVGVDGCKVI
ncbi:hypothetical protein [Microcoleus sp. PH2017_24_DOB_U_A]|jgi:hypothetical protein|uniref:hypothetical protein n=1 Tax=Microcoleus sp. PH2017_24_DOB_U_A TaxID=2798834 RepID=UPI001D2B068C|nr:hypothetical protein [Microcoleus sp. PH2017_24_DOB_U_A]MCC3548575.1 hypothetical protein [Microcoleus sp. PH2017_24_DOB_U_A]